MPLNFGPMPHTEAIQRPTLTSPVGGHTREEKLAAFGRLLDIMDDLREGCPWDRKQNFESLRHLTIEETYELADAILSEDLEEVGKEVGDLMLHMVFYSRLGSEAGVFDAADTIMCQTTITNLCSSVLIWMFTSMLSVLTGITHDYPAHVSV